MFGLVLVLRDLVHRELGVKWAAGAIVTGAALSAFLAPPALVVASCAALLMSQFTDLAAYAPLYRRRLSCGAPHPTALGVRWSKRPSKTGAGVGHPVLR